MLAHSQDTTYFGVARVRHLTACTLEVGPLQGQHANRPKELPVLPQLQGLSLCAEDVGRKILLSVVAQTCEMSHLHAPTFPAAPTASTQTSRRVHSSRETGRSRLNQKDGEAFSLVRKSGRRGPGLQAGATSPFASPHQIVVIWPGDLYVPHAGERSAPERNSALPWSWRSGHQRRSICR
jgi:hypothetical protein